MKKNLKRGLSVLLLIALIFTVSIEAFAADRIQPGNKNIVQLAVLYNSDNQFFTTGTAVKVGTHQLLTAAHCLQKTCDTYYSDVYYKIYQQKAADKFIKCTVVKMDTDLDMALLEEDEVTPDRLKIAVNYIPSDTLPLYTVGYTPLKNVNLSQNLIFNCLVPIQYSLTDHYYYNKSAFVFTGKIYGGFSGTAALTQNNEIVSILNSDAYVSLNGVTTNYAFGVSNEQLNTFITPDDLK